MCNSEASPNLSSTPSSVHGLDLPPPGKLDQLRRVRIIADGEGFYPSRPAANVISAGIQKLYDGFYPTWSDVSDRTKQGVFNEFMKSCTWSLSRIELFKVILRRRHLLYCHACFLKLEVTYGGLDGLGQIIGRNLLYTGSLQNFKRRAIRQRQLESPRRVAHWTRVVRCLWGQLRGNWKHLLVDQPLVKRYGRRPI